MSISAGNDYDPEIDERAFRDVLGCFATGVTVITTLDGGGAPVGLVVNSFSSVSLDPPLILWSISLNAPSLVCFREHRGFAVNIMGADAKEETLNFARPSENKFAGVDWRPGFAGVPLLGSALATIECCTTHRMPGGDHEVHFGRVKGFAMQDGDPLLFHRGRFAEIGAPL